MIRRGSRMLGVGELQHSKLNKDQEFTAQSLYRRRLLSRCFRAWVEARKVLVRPGLLVFGFSSASYVKHNAFTCLGCISVLYLRGGACQLVDALLITFFHESVSPRVVALPAAVVESVFPRRVGENSQTAPGMCCVDFSSAIYAKHFQRNSAVRDLKSFSILASDLENFLWQN